MTDLAFQKAVRRALRGSAALLVLALTTTLILASLLISLRVEQVVRDFADRGSQRIASQLAQRLALSLQFGVNLDANTGVQSDLDSIRLRHPNVLAIQVRLPDDRVAAVSGTAVGQRVLREEIKPSWAVAVQAKPLFRSASSNTVLGLSFDDATNQPGGTVWMVLARSESKEAFTTTFAQLLPWSVSIAFGLSLGVGALVLVWSQSTAAQLRAYAGTAPGAPPQLAAGTPGLGRDALALALAAALMVAGLVGVFAQARHLAAPLVESQLARNAESVLTSAKARVEQAVQLGIPVNAMIGLADMLALEMLDVPEVAALGLQDATSQRSLVSSGAQQALTAGAADINTDSNGRSYRLFRAQIADTTTSIVAATPQDFVTRSVRSALLDVALAVVVALILLREAVGAWWQRTAVRALLGFEWARARGHAVLAQQVRTDFLAQFVGSAAAIPTTPAIPTPAAPFVTAGKQEFAKIRLVVFLTALSDELLRPFFAVFASELPGAFGLDALSPTTRVALPIALFMLALAVAQPLGPWIARRVEPRRALGLIALVGAGLLVATALCQSLWLLTGLRTASGVTYGLVLILCQTIILRITDFKGRARGLVEVSAAIVAAGVCGPVLGGFVADSFGFAAGLMACAVCMLGASVATLRIAPVTQASMHKLTPIRGWDGFKAVTRHRTVMAVTWFAAVPARLAAAALLLVATPLYLSEAGESAAVAGRVLTLYFLCFIAVAPWAAHWSDASGRRKPWVYAGCIISALACAALPLLGGPLGPVWASAVCCAMLGVGQAFLSAPQLALVTQAFETDPSATQRLGATPEQALAAFRMIERVGSIAAAFFVAGLAAAMSLTAAVLVIAALLGITTLALVVSIRGLVETPSTGLPEPL